MATKLTKTKRELLADIAGDEWKVYEGMLGGFYKSTDQGFVSRVNRTTLRALLAMGLVEVSVKPLGQWSRFYYVATEAGRQALKEHGDENV